MNEKDYDKNSNIIYELKNDNGKIKEYNKYSKLIFLGEYLNGKRNGKGKEYDKYNSKLEYEGEYLKGKKMEKEKNMIRRDI